MFRWHTEAWASVIVISKTHGSSVFIWGNCEAHAQRNSLHPSVNSGELKLACPSLCINKWSWRDIDSSPRRDDTDVKPACQVLFACLCDLYSTQVSQSVITSVYNRRLGYLTRSQYKYWCSACVSSHVQERRKRLKMREIVLKMRDHRSFQTQNHWHSRILRHEIMWAACLSGWERNKNSKVNPMLR